MAEQIPYGVAGSIINRLASLAFRELGRIYGVKDELKKLEETVGSIRAVLLDAEEKQDQELVKNWITRLKRGLHDADDLLDDLSIQDLRCKVNGDIHGKAVSQVRDFFSSNNQLVFRCKMARKVEKIRQQFNDVAKDMSDLKLNQRMEGFRQNGMAQRETDSFVLQSDIIGREESKKEIIDLLKKTDANQNVTAIAIVGIGGLGKTGLAQLVYNDAEVKNHFQERMWVCVSEDFEVKSILRIMLKSLDNGAAGDLQLDQIQKNLQEKLRGQRYMLFLDDVWNENPLRWDDLTKYLMCGGEGSKILVTTRSKEVAETMKISSIPYFLKGLTEEQSWDLLKNMAFGDDARRISPKLVSIGKRIAKRCSGVPLAVKTVGGLLRSKNEESEWLNILNGDFWRLCKERESIMPVLKLSYQNLPPGLKQCFAYCSLYPKDWEIKKDVLIQLWMAQGYLECSETQCMEGVGNQYVKILLMRSFIQDASMNEYGDITSFKMHDLMHDLATSVAGSDCRLHNEGQEIVGRPMHVSFVSDIVCSLESLDASKLRTILRPIPWAGNMVGFVANPSIIKSLKYLRVLDLSESSITTLPKSISKFKHLRYLDLSDCDELISLPESIGDLVSLQTVKLRGCRKLVFRVEIITKLINLRHLDTEGCKAFEEMMPTGLGKLTSLQSLSKFVVGDDKKSKSGKLNELKDLSNIRGDLTISNLGFVKDVASESQEANLKEKKHIQSLTLQWGEVRLTENKITESLQLLDNLCPHQDLRQLKIREYPGVRFSSWLSSLTNVVEISLCDFSNCQQIPPLERLPSLKNLEMRRMNELKYMQYDETSDVFFPSLESLILYDCENLRGWQRLADVNSADDIDNHRSLPYFPRLSYLEIDLCPNLTCMPTCPRVEKLQLRSSSVKLIENKITESLQLLDNLCPHQDLRQLEIREYPGLRFSSWLSSLTNIVEISLHGLFNCQQLPQLERLPSLKNLEMRQIIELKYMQYDEISDVFFPSLESLILYDCENLRGWQRLADVNSADDIDDNQLPYFPRLSYLEIAGCPNLTCMPTYPRVEKLELRSSSVKPLIETCLVQPQRFSPYPPPGLKDLVIDSIDIEALPEKWMQNLTSLERLSIWSFPTIAPLLPQLQHLPAELKELDIGYVDKLDLWKDEEGVSTQSQSLHCLRSLQEITVHNCEDWNVLSEQICNLQSLRYLKIWICDSLESLPERMRCLTNLQTLDLRNCSFLYENRYYCPREEWPPQIAHIPNVLMD